MKRQEDFSLYHTAFTQQVRHRLISSSLTDATHSFEGNMQDKHKVQGFQLAFTEYIIIIVNDQQRGMSLFYCTKLCMHHYSSVASRVNKTLGSSILCNLKITINNRFYHCNFVIFLSVQQYFSLLFIGIVFLLFTLQQ